VSYFEPEGVPEEVKKKLQEQRRVIRVRFRNKEDALVFTEKTGIPLMHKRISKISYPQRDLFELG